MKKAITLLLTMALLLTAMATGVMAAEEGSMWLRLADDGKTVYVVSNAPVVDGQLVLTYTGENVSYESLEVNPALVGKSAVNGTVAGEVSIAWVTSQLPADFDCDWLFKVTLSGEGAVILSGKAYTADGTEVTLMQGLDTAGLENAIASARAVDPSQYTAASYANLAAALASAEAVLADITSDQNDMTVAQNQLRGAIAALETNTAAAANSLANAISHAESLDTSKYTLNTVANLQSAISAAKMVLWNANSTITELQQAEGSIWSAISALEPLTVGASRSLRSAIEAAEALDASKYTAESYAKLTSAVQGAKAVLSNAHSEAHDMNAAEEQIRKAISELVRLNAAVYAKLEAAVAEAAALDEALYTADSFAPVKAALAEARMVLVNEDATDAELNAAEAALRNAMSGLKLLTDAAAEALAAAMDKAEALDDDAYTAESMAEVNKAIADAKAVLADDDATVAEMEAAKAAISIAVSNLVPKSELAAAELEKAIAEAEALLEGPYTAETLNALRSAVSNARVLLADGADYITLENAIAEIRTAMSELKLLTDAAREDLTALVNQVKELKEDEYTTESFGALKAAIEQAISVMGNDNATVAELEAAEDAIREAKQNLKFKPAPQPTQPSQPTQPTQPDPSDDTDGGNGALVVLLIVAAVLAVGVIVVVIFKKKRGAAK